MSTETTFSRRWKRPSPAFLLVIVITALGLLISVALPRLLLPKFSNKATGISFQVRVTDDQGVPVPNAKVCLGAASEETDLEGDCQVTQDYLAKGIRGLTGTCRLEGHMLVEAPGYISWRRSLVDLFGHNYNYFDKGTNVHYEVTLYR
jgi:hypothetical protein